MCETEDGMELNGGEDGNTKQPPPCSEVRHSLRVEVGDNDIATRGLSLIGEGYLCPPIVWSVPPTHSSANGVNYKCKS